ncbi:MAG: arsenite methyltransferase [Sedimentisphaerales bacterium]|nr:arsenite methyltransferase [Sedimentisphaerales bacterium]
MAKKDDKIGDWHEIVRREYEKIAQQGGSCCGPSCCGTSGPSAYALGYEHADLEAVPDGVDMGLGCGNPTALAALRPGEVVLDLGCGPGLDVFIAAKKVGPTGRVIGVDMTAEMLAKARASARSFSEKTGLDNVEFRLGQIEHLPVADASVDVVISNCVINLSPDKQQVWREIARVLRPGGRVAVSDLALLRPLPEALRQSVEALVGCIAGAVLVDETKAMVQDAGLVDAVFQIHPEYVDRMAHWSDPVYKEVLEALPDGTRPSDYITSLYVTAVKPQAALTDQVKELIAIGASVSANCHPCVRYHVKKARDLGISDHQIRQAIEAGRMVRKGAAGQMDELIGQLFG